MSLSDLLNIVAIVLAIFAFLKERERETIILKFVKLEKISLSVALLLIIYLILFDTYFYAWGWSADLLIMESGTWLAPNVYAFFLSFLIIIYVLYKISIAQYPKTSYGQLLHLYNKWSGRGEYSRVIEFIEKNHTKQIQYYLVNLGSLNFKFEEEQKSKDQFSFSRFNEHDQDRSIRHRFIARAIIDNFLSNDAFIEKTAIYHPDVYLSILVHYRFESFVADRMLTKFIEVLLFNNHQLIKNKFIQMNDRLLTTRNLKHSNSFFKYYNERFRPTYSLYDSNLFQLGQRALLDKEHSHRLLNEFNLKNTQDCLHEHLITDVCFLLFLDIKHAIETKKDHRAVETDAINIKFFVSYVRTIIKVLRDDRNALNPKSSLSDSAEIKYANQPSYSNLGFEIILFFGQILSTLVINIAIGSKNAMSVENIILNYKLILFELEEFLTPRDIKDNAYKMFFNIYIHTGSDDGIDDPIREEVRNTFRKVLLQHRIVYDSNKMNVFIKKRWTTLRSTYKRSRLLTELNDVIDRIEV